MSVHRIPCPDCSYQLLYARLGSQASYRTDRTFALTCARAGEIATHDAMNCPTLRAACERILKVQLPGSTQEP